jgi:23S rRNA pseudouridine1911/1915/1917 synthase
MMHTWIIPPLEQRSFFELRVDTVDPRPLQHYLAERLQRTPAEIRLWIRQGHILCEGQPTRFSLPPRPDSTLQITPPLLEPPAAVPENLPLERVYEDDYVVVVNKPSGMATHPSSGWWQGSCVSALLYHERDWPGIKGVAGPGIVHRLDKNTSGLLVFAKTHLAQQGLLKLFKQRQLEREYLAVTHRWPASAPRSGSWHWPLGRDPEHSLKECVRSDGKSALTHYKVLDPERYSAFIPEAGQHLTWVALKLGTGRTHQIRVHLHYAGTPILNDGLYGAARADWPTVMTLHAYRLRFQHPIHSHILAFYRAPLHWSAGLETESQGFSGLPLPDFENL